MGFLELLRPYGIVIAGELRLGLEAVRERGSIVALRPHTGIPDDFVLSVPFVNAHSHLEYRGLQDQLCGLPYWEWIRELTLRKRQQNDDEVREHCLLAARENRASGVGLIGEHSDRPFAGDALRQSGVRGRIFQEVITFFEGESPGEKLASVRARAEVNLRDFADEVFLSPHSLYTVDPATLAAFGASAAPLSLHLAESTHERAFFESGRGPIASFYESNQVPLPKQGRSPAEVAADFGLLRPGAQLVHCCDLSASDIALVARSGATVAHCPRSNMNLGCPPAPVRELLDAGVDVGLGLDSAASSGPIDMFAEMRAALSVAERRGHPLLGEEVWRMATTMGARTLERDDWDLREGWSGPLLAIHIGGADLVHDLIAKGKPEAVRWIE